MTSLDASPFPLPRRELSPSDTWSLLEKLSRPPFLEDGFCRTTLPFDEIDIRTDVALYLLDQGFCEEPLPFETLHKRLPLDLQRSIAGKVNAVSTRVYKASPQLVQNYHAIVRYLAREEFGIDFVFEANPFLRFHFPGPQPDCYRSDQGALLAHHSDLLLGDYFEQINCWLPLSRCYGTSALQCASLESSIQILNQFALHFGMGEADFSVARVAFFDLLYTDSSFHNLVVSSCVPAATRYGEIVMFDPRVVHATAENLEDSTRVSIDFRLLPLTAYEHVCDCINSGLEPPRSYEGKRLLRGEYYDSRTAFAL